LDYLNDLEQQFASMPYKNTFGGNLTLDAVEDALRVRAAYQVYCSVVKGLKKDKAHFKSKVLLNEVY
jgi:hypothetical protein